MPLLCLLFSWIGIFGAHLKINSFTQTDTFHVGGSEAKIAKAWKQPRVSLMSTKRKISWIMSQEKLTGILLDKTNEFEATWEPWAKYLGIALIPGITA